MAQIECEKKIHLHQVKKELFYSCSSSHSRSVVFNDDDSYLNSITKQLLDYKRTVLLNFSQMCTPNSTNMKSP